MAADVLGALEARAPPPPKMALLSWGGGRRRDLRAPVLAGWPCISGEADAALLDYTVKLPRMGRKREAVWPPDDGRSLYHAAGLACGALTGSDYEYGACSAAAEAWVRARATEVVARMQSAGAGAAWGKHAVAGAESPDEAQRRWTALRAPAAAVALGLAPAPDVQPHPAEVRALACALGRVVVLLHSRRASRADPLDLRGLLYVFHPDDREARVLRADPELRLYVEGEYPADAYAWGEFQERTRPGAWGGSAADLGDGGLEEALVLVHDALEGSYAATTSSGALQSEPLRRRLAAAFVS